jgi:predicted XRE-type DNA-binding protein
MALFRDPIPELKEHLASEILALVGHINQHVAARILGIDQPRMSDLMYGRLERFSASKLIRILGHVDRRVDITVVNEGPPVLRWFDFSKSAGAGQKAP